MTDPVAAAETTDYDAFVLEPDGQRLAQSTNPAVVHRILRLLDVHPGHRVLEVGTGSGYTAAMLSRLTGATGQATGHVVSVDVDPALIERAENKHRVFGSSAEFHAADGFTGWKNTGPYDRIVGWATPPRHPRCLGRTGQRGRGHPHPDQRRAPGRCAPARP